MLQYVKENNCFVILERLLYDAAFPVFRTVFEDLQECRIGGQAHIAIPSNLVNYSLLYRHGLVVPDLIFFETTARKHAIEDCIFPQGIQTCHFAGYSNQIWNGKLLHWVDDNIWNARYLAHFDIYINGPMKRQYEFTGFDKPFPHQIVCADFMSVTAKGFNLSTMGTGKTKTTLWAFDYLKKYNIVHKMLVSTTNLCTTEVWEPEILVTTPHLKYMVLKGSKQSRLNKLKAAADIYIINHDGVKILEDELILRRDIDCVCLDESTIAKNSQSDMHFAHREVAKGRKVFWNLTGGPTANGAMDAWGQGALLQKNQYYRKSEFELLTTTTISHGLQKKPQRKNKKGWVFYTVEALWPHIRVDKKDCLILPDISEHYIEVAMSREQQSAYTQMINQFRIDAKKGTITAVNAQDKMNKLIQISGGCVYHKTVDEKGAREVAYYNCDNKLDALRQQIKASQGKVILLAQYEHTINMLKNWLDAEGYKSSVISGKVTGKRRTEAMWNFKKGNAAVLLAIAKIISHGENLTMATTIIWWNPVYNLDTLEQANERTNRPGQKKGQMIIYLVCSKAEQAVWAAVKHKQSMQATLLELIKRR